MNFLHIYFALIIFFISYKHYKNLFNPIGIFCTLWLVVVFMYNLKLSFLLQDLSPLTYVAIYLGVISFIFGSLFLTRRTYAIHDQQPSFEDNKKIKLVFFYFLFLIITILEIYLATPAFLSENKLETYLSPTGRGIVFLHMAVAMLPVSYILIFMDSGFKKIHKFILFFPPFIILTMWMERGMLLGYLTMIIVIYYRKKAIKKIFVNFFILFFCLTGIIHFIGTIRSSSSFRGPSYINQVSDMKVRLPSSLVWLYIYPTTSLANFDRVIKNKNTEFRYGLDLLRPVLTILQLDYVLGLEETRNDFDILAGFNTPSYLYFCYKNFSFFGFFLIPFLMGMISQYLYNQYADGKPIGIALYGIWFSYLVVTFHDFLLWNSIIVFSFFLIIISIKKVKFI